MYLEAKLFIILKSEFFMEVKLEFETLKFREMGNSVRAIFMNYFYFDIGQDELLDIGGFEVRNKILVFKDQKESLVKMSPILPLQSVFTWVFYQ